MSMASAALAFGGGGTTEEEVANIKTETAPSQSQSTSLPSKKGDDKNMASSKSSIRYWRILASTAEVWRSYQQLLASESARLSQIDMLRIDAEAGGLDGGRAMVKLKLLENTEKEERVVMEVKLKVAQRAAAKYLKENNPFEQEKAAAQARADGIVADAAAKRSASKSKIAALHAKMGLDQ